MSYQVEVTDTFGGEANYCWVRRYLIDSPPQEYGTPEYRRALVRNAKAAAGWTGVKCRTYRNHDADITLHPRGACQVMFITSWDEIMDDHFDGEDLRTATDETDGV